MSRVCAEKFQVLLFVRKLQICWCRSLVRNYASIRGSRFLEQLFLNGRATSKHFSLETRNILHRRALNAKSSQAVDIGCTATKDMPGVVDLEIRSVLVWTVILLSW